MHKSFWDNEYYTLRDMTICIVMFLAVFLFQTWLYNQKCAELEKLYSQNYLLQSKIDTMEHINK